MSDESLRLRQSIHEIDEYLRDLRVKMIHLVAPFKVNDYVESKYDCSSRTGDTILSGQRYRVVSLDNGGWPILHTDRCVSEGWVPDMFEPVQ